MERRKSAFISRSHLTDVGVLRHELERRGVEVLDLDSSPFDTVVDSVRARLRGVDFVIFVLWDRPISSWVIYEYGIASALNKPCLVVASPGADVPEPMRTGLVIQATPSAVEAIGFNLDMFLERLAPGSSVSRSSIRRSKVAKDTPPTIEWPGERLQAIEDGPLGRRGLAAEQLVADLFEEAGQVVVQKREMAGGLHDGGVDLAVWLDEVDELLGNPLLICVKVGREFTPRRLDEIEHRLRASIIRARGSAGLLIYHPSLGGVGPRPSGMPFVFRIGLVDFVSRVTSGSLYAWLRSERNKALHGIG